MPLPSSEVRIGYKWETSSSNLFTAFFMTSFNASVFLAGTTDGFEALQRNSHFRRQVRILPFLSDGKSEDTGPVKSST